MRIEKRILLVLDGKDLTLSEMAEELVILSGRLSHALIKLELSGLLMRTAIQQVSAQLSQGGGADSCLWSRKC